MPKHLKTKIIDALETSCATFVSLPPSATPHARTVRFLTFCEGIDTVHKAMDMNADGRKHKKRIIVRPSRHRPGLHELYTYHFPKTWSAACVANRQLIKTAQRMAHAIERDHSLQALEWRVRFLHQLYTLPVWYKDMTDVPVSQRRYPHFYSYVFATIYHSLRAAAQTAQQEMKQTDSLPQNDTAALQEVTFEPIAQRPASFSCRCARSHRPFAIRPFAVLIADG